MLMGDEILSSPGCFFKDMGYMAPGSSIGFVPTKIPLSQVGFGSLLQNSHTQANRHQTAKKKPSQTFQPIPVRSAILSILRMVPLNLTLVLSKLSFILSANAEESRISSPMAIVSCLSWPTLEESMLVFSLSFCDSRDSRTEWEYWPLHETGC
jgi:hypothetical protein